MRGELDPREALDPSRFVDSNHPDVRDFTESVVRGVRDPRERIALLFAVVRDRLRYDPYSVTAEPRDYHASAILDGGPTWCVPKAVLLTASLRAAGIPAVLGFSDVRNHLNSASLLELMGTDLFVFHGWSAVYVDQLWRKGSPAFNSELCRRFGVPPLEFDGSRDALLHAADGAGRRHMEYVRERGMFVDLPFDELMATLLHTYGSAMVRGSDTPRPQDPRFRA
ncbi:transglutaminase [Nocardioides sp. Soil777]|uniref:transglutaminase-like domain-containing protein n=1 Tax=Nocardioides sp. Soil777 TaxID=1736409 RepID=UPI000702D052|nr:transglutaminase family protein [Nocardioides sp. Soil777]KRE98953.1 transglutaminase [Nocardioides sp. Soil777]